MHTLARGSGAEQNVHTTIRNRTWVDAIYGCRVARSRHCYAALKRDAGGLKHYVLSFRARAVSGRNMAQLKNVPHFVADYPIRERGWRSIEILGAGGRRDLGAI